MREAAKAASKAAEAEQEAAKSRGRMSHPPTCRWPLEGTNKYCTFLSHYKV